MTTYSEIVLGDRPGYLAVAYGWQPHRDGRGRYKHREWLEQRYRWPAERGVLVREVRRLLATQERVDCYVCPAVRYTDRRRQGDALPPMVCWADIDRCPDDDGQALLRALDPFVVESGSEGHRHLYVPLTRPVDLGTHRLLGRALAAALDADAKWSDEALLRVPSTRNHKSDPPTLVRPLPWSGRRWDPDALAMLLGVDLAAPAAPRTPVPRVVAEPPPVPLPIRVRWALAHPDVTDRSAAHHRLVGACREAGLTLGQCLAVVARYGPSAEKYGDRLAEQTARSWERCRPAAGVVMGR